MSADYGWSVPADHPAFAGHFPGRPIVPGVVLLDRAVLFAEQLLGAAPTGWQIGNAKFFSPVEPGEELVFTLDARPGGAIAFSIRGAGRAIASGSLSPATP
ncbi:MAG: hypothetical protein ACM3X0_15075 [Bacteroidota bacterium]